MLTGPSRSIFSLSWATALFGRRRRAFGLGDPAVGALGILGLGVIDELHGAELAPFVHPRHLGRDAIEVHIHRLQADGREVREIRFGRRPGDLEAADVGPHVLEAAPRFANLSIVHVMLRAQRRRSIVGSNDVLRQRVERPDGFVEETLRVDD